MPVEYDKTPRTRTRSDFLWEQYGWDTKNFSAWVVQLPQLPDETDPDYAQISYILKVFEDFRERDLKIRDGLRPRASASARLEAETFKMAIEASMARLQDDIMSHKRIVLQEKARDNLRVIEKRIVTGDTIRDGNMMNRIMGRLSQFDGVRLIIDFDITATENDDYRPLFPGSIQAHNYMASVEEGRKAFPLVFAMYWQPILAQNPEAFAYVSRHIKFRDGFGDFLKLLRKKHISRTVLSANFKPIVTSSLQTLGDVAEGLNVVAVTPESIWATEKGWALNELCCGNSSLVPVALVDSMTDLPLLESVSKRHIAFFMTPEDSRIRPALEKEKTPFLTYRNFFDGIKQLQELKIL